MPLLEAKKPRTNELENKCIVGPVLVRKRGRPPGKQGPRKKPGEYSTNAHTVRARARMNDTSIPEWEQGYRRLKANDQSAITHALKKLRRQPDFDENKTQSQLLINKTRFEVILNR